MLVLYFYRVIETIFNQLGCFFKDCFLKTHGNGFFKTFTHFQKLHKCFVGSSFKMTKFANYIKNNLVTVSVV